MRQGPGKYFLRSFERSEPIAEAISLKPNEYVPYTSLFSPLSVIILYFLVGVGICQTNHLA